MFIEIKRMLGHCSSSEIVGKPPKTIGMVIVFFYGSSI